MKFVGIIGHGERKLGKKVRDAMKEHMKKRLKDFLKEDRVTVVSGHSPLAGVDWMAEEVAREMSLPLVIYAPKEMSWSGTGGFKERNLSIVRESDIVLVYLVNELPPNFQGMRFDSCYHCEKWGDYPPHIKSGACWTAFKAIQMGKEAVWYCFSQEGKMCSSIRRR